jgi:hypothetical protein
MISRNPCLSNRNGSIYSDTLHDIEVAGYRYVMLTICIFGIVCNLLNLCVLLQRRLKESPYTYLTGLAVADMLTLMSISPMSIVRGDYIRNDHLFFLLTRFELHISMPLANYFGQVSIMITLALTIERYLFTTYPLRTRTFCKPLYARIVISLILVVCALLSFPRFLSDTTRQIIDDEKQFNSSICSSYPFLVRYSSTNSTHIGQCFCVHVYTREHFQAYKDRYYYTQFVLNQILPVLVLFYLNLKLIRRVQQSNRYTLAELVARQQDHQHQHHHHQQQHHHHHHQRTLTNTTTATASTPPMLPTPPVAHTMKQKRLRDEYRLTKTLVAIVVVFLICNTFTIISYPGLVKKFTEKKYPNYRHGGFRLQKLITNMMLLLNYSINFFFYCAFNQKFLDTLKLICRRRLCPGTCCSCQDNLSMNHLDDVHPRRRCTMFTSMRSTSGYSPSYPLSTVADRSTKPLVSIGNEPSMQMKQRRSQCCLRTTKDANDNFE